MNTGEAIHRLESVIGRAEGVSGAAYFGSIAKGTNDDLSDIDLLVRCDQGVAQDLVSALDATLGIILYRPFSTERKPSGRYWFASTSPFLRLDVSFHDPAVFDDLLEHGGEFARAPFTHVPLSAERHALPSARPRVWPGGDEHFALALRNFQESAKALLRDTEPKHPLVETLAAVRSARTPSLRTEVWELYEKSRLVLHRAGKLPVTDSE